MALAALARRVVRDKPLPIAARPSIDEFETLLMARGRLTPFVADKFRLAREVCAHTELVIYTAGALTGTSESDKDRYRALGCLVDSHRVPGARMFGYVPHLHGTDPVKHRDVSPDEVHDVDLLWSTIAADLQLHLMRPVAHGNGAEGGWAGIFGVSAAYFTPTSTKTSRLMLGTHNSPVEFAYDDFTDDCVPMVARLLGFIEAELLCPTLAG